VAKRAFHPQRTTDELHGWLPLVNGRALQHLNIFKNLLGGLRRFPHNRGLCARLYNSGQTAGDSQRKQGMYKNSIHAMFLNKRLLKLGGLNFGQFNRLAQKIETLFSHGQIRMARDIDSLAIRA
jgi:hypothetical protein